MRLDGSADGTRPTILVIDDESKIRGVVRDVIAEDTGRCLMAASGREGLAIAAKRPELVVLDLGLPDMDGIVVCRKLREWTSAPIVVLSARGSKHRKRWEDVLEIMDAGINVISAVNVQHLESLDDVMQRTLSAAVRETVPDWVISRAD